MDFSWLSDIFTYASLFLLPLLVGYTCWHNVYDYNSLADVVAAIGANEGTIFIPDEQAVADDLAVPSNVTLKPIQGGSFNIASGKTLTINGHVDAGLYQIFKGTGNVSFGSNSIKEIYPQWLGAKGDGATNDTTAIERAVSAFPSSGGTLVFSMGTFIFDDIVLPASPKIIDIIGQGPRSTVFQPATANTKLFEGPASGVLQGNKIGGFSIKAHVSGSTGEAVNMDAMRQTLWHDIEFLTNGSGNFAKGFLLKAERLCYGNILDGIIVDSQTGPTTIISFENGGDAITNANQNYLRHFWINANATGVTTIIDGRRSALVVVEKSIFEGNTNATVIIPGTAWSIKHNWFELNNLDISPQTGTTGNSNAVLLEENYFGSASTITIPATIQDWLILNNPPSGNLTVTDGGSNNLIILGRSFESSHINAALQLKNIGAGGATWQLLYPRTGGLLPAGFVIRDSDNVKNPIWINPDPLDYAIVIDSTGVGIGNGTKISKHISGIVEWNPGNIVDGAQTSTTVTVTGASVGDTVCVGFAIAVPAGALLVGAVTATNTVTVTLFNKTGGDLDLGNAYLRADVWQH